MRAVALLQSGLTAERVGRSFVIEVSLSAYDPGLAGSITRAYADAYLADHLNANFDATQRATVWLQGRIGELRDRSQEAALEVETFRAENGLTAARGELMSEQQLSDLNSQLVVAQADTANALARYTQYKSIIDSGPENAVKNATIPTDKANSSVLNELKTPLPQHHQARTGRYDALWSRPSAGGGAAPRTGRCDTADIPGAAATHRELSQRIRGREIARDIAAQQCRRDDRPEFAIEPVDGAVARARAEIDGARHALPVVPGSLRGGIAAALVSDRPGPRDLAGRKPDGGVQPAQGDGAWAVAGAGPDRRRLCRRLPGIPGAVFPHRRRCAGGAQRQLPRLSADHRQSPCQTKAKPGDAERPAAAARPAMSVTPRILRVAINAPSSSFAETLRNVKLAADVVLQRSPCKVIGFVSVLPHEGKTTVAANFAGLLAANGVEDAADRRRPQKSRA